MTKRKELPPIQDEFRIKINSSDEFYLLAEIIKNTVGHQTDENNNLKWRFRKFGPDGKKLTGARCRLLEPLRRGKPQNIAIEVFVKDHTLDNDDLLMIKVKGV